MWLRSTSSVGRPVSSAAAASAAVSASRSSPISPSAWTSQPYAREAADHVVAERQARRAVDRDAVVVVDRAEPPEPQVSRQRRRLVRDALHQVAVARDHPGAVVDELGADGVAQEPLGDRHADRVGEPLAERAGGDLDPRRDADLGVARRAALELAKPAEVVDATGRSRSGAAASTAGSTRGRTTARTGRGRASAGRRDRGEARARRARRRAAQAPSPCRCGRSAPPPARPSRGHG